MYITRDLESVITKALDGGKVVILYGARQTGKTTMIEHLLDEGKLKDEGVVVLSGDIMQERELLDYNSMTVEKAKGIIGGAKTLFIDEAQKVMDIGLTLKILHDHIKDVRIIATGSSSFELSEKIGEPLTGRMDEYTLHTLSFAELARHTSSVIERNSLNDRLLYGSYPEIYEIQHELQRKRALRSLCSAYLFKDVLKWESLRNSDMLGKLTKALALQLGNEVSYNEVGNLIGMDNETVEAYIERLEKAFVVFRLGSYAKNHRNELKKSRKVYFRDTGIRNAIIGDYRPLDVRDDSGHLFENYLIAERMKYNALHEIDVKTYFWRTIGNESKEIDYLEESVEKGLVAYEFKWNPSKAAKAKCPKGFASAYPEATWKCISRDNYVEFLSGLI